ncbi:MAG: STM3941 family protein [Flavobacteriia bacterium]|jgi:hypothetical protein
MTTEEIIILKSPKKQGLLFLGCIGFVIAGFYMINAETGTRKYSPTFIHFFGYIGIIFFGGIGFLALLDMFKSKPALKINSLGIKNNTYAGKGYLIEWENIKSLQIKSVYGKKFIILKLKDYSKVYEQIGLFSRLLLKMNEKQYDTPVFITTVMIDKKIEEILRQIQNYRKEIKESKKLTKPI